MLLSKVVYSDLFEKLTSVEEGYLSEVLEGLAPVSDQEIASHIEFMKKAGKAGLDAKTARDFLAELPAGGLSSAMELFDASRWEYRREHLALFQKLAHLMAYPLCQTIFEARMRCFSPYAEVVDPLSQPNVAIQLFEQLMIAKQEEDQIKIFFNYFAQYKPFPPSQDYIVKVDINEYIVRALSEHAGGVTLGSTFGSGDKVVFDAIKYTVAHYIESDDMCSTRDYDRLMGEIWSAFNPAAALLPSAQQPYSQLMQGRTLYSPRSQQATGDSAASADASHSFIQC